MQSARPVAAFTTDGMPAKHRFVVLVSGVFDRFHLIGVTVKTGALHRTTGPRPRGKTGGKVPNLLLRKPAHGGLQHETIPHVQVGMAPCPGADGEVGLVVKLVDRLAFLVETGLAMKHAVANAIDNEASVKRLKRIVPGGIVGLAAGNLGDRRDRPPHGMAGVRFGDFRMTRSALCVADACHPGTDIVIRAGVSQTGIGRKIRNGWRKIGVFTLHGVPRPPDHDQTGDASQRDQRNQPGTKATARPVIAWNVGCRRRVAGIHRIASRETIGRMIMPVGDHSTTKKDPQRPCGGHLPDTAWL